MKLSRQWSNRILTFAAPAILCIVAARQVMLVQTQRLTPWKGGGFGMFSTVESGSTRIFRVRLEKREGDKVMALPVKLPPELAPLVQDLTQRPTERSAENLAVVLSNLTWLEAPELDDVYRLSAAEFAAVAVSSQVSGQSTPILKRVLEAPRAWIGGFKSSEKFGKGRPVPFDYAVVEVWQLEFDEAKRELKSRQIIDAAERRPPRNQGGVS